MNTNQIRKLSSENMLVALVTTISGLLLGLSISFVFDGIVKPDICNLVIGVLLLTVFFFVTCLWTIRSVKSVFFKSSAYVTKQGDAEKCKALILTLSTIPKKDLENHKELLGRLDLENSKKLTDEQRLQVLDKICAIKNLDNEENKEGASFQGWKWQQPFRLFRHNYTDVKIIYVVLSKEAEPFYDDFKKVVSKLTRNETQIESFGQALDLNAYDKLYKCLMNLVKRAINEHNLTHGDICLDITSGTKTFSAAATVATLNNKTKFSYVATGGHPDEGQVMLYDAMVQV